MGRKAKERIAIKAEAADRAARIVAVYPRHELHLFYVHRTRDMSVSGEYSDDMTIPLSEIRKGEALNTDAIGCGRVLVLEVSGERLMLNWEGVDYVVDSGIPVNTATYSVNNPLLSYEEVYLRFEFNYVSAERILSDTFDSIAEYHSRINCPNYPETESRQALVLALLEELCKRDVEFRIPLAILSDADNWAEVNLVRPYIFRRLLLEGAKQGALSPENEFVWSWIRIVALQNPAEFTDNKQFYIELFAPAVEAGNEVAREIVDTLSDNSDKS